jgi:hypothetical protein
MRHIAELSRKVDENITEKAAHENLHERQVNFPLGNARDGTLSQSERTQPVKQCRSSSRTHEITELHDVPIPKQTAGKNLSIRPLHNNETIPSKQLSPPMMTRTNPIQYKRKNETNQKTIGADLPFLSGLDWR